MSDASLQTRARETECFADALRELAGLLPDDDGALDVALLESVRDRDEDAFAHLLLAALHAGRRVDGRILAEGAALLQEPEMIVTAAVHCAGDVGGALLRAVRGGRLDIAREALALVLSAWWSRERAGCEIPVETIRHGRVLARNPRPFVATELLLVLSDLAGDAHLVELLSAAAPPEAMAGARSAFDRAIERTREDPLGCVPAERPQTVFSGYTVRRAASRVGRNDPCPCGSGKKYKRCCFERDRERLRHSSDVEGLTVEELRENPEPHITRQRLYAMSPAELARLDATRIDPALLASLAHRLTWSREFDAVVRLFETADHRPELDDYLLDAVEEAADLGQAETVKRLLAVRGDHGDSWGRLRLGARIMAEGLEPGPLLERIESEARDRLDEEHGPLELAHTLLGGPCSALGIVVARGALWTANPLDGWALLQKLLETRDRLGLDPGDPVEDPVEERWRGEDEDRESGEVVSAADEETRGELEAKLAEARRLRVDLRERDRTLRRMELRMEEVEARSRPGETGEGETRVAGSGDDDAVVVELRRRLAERKAELKRQHAERNELRAELERTRREAESLRARALDGAHHRGSGEEHEEPEDEALLLPEESAEKQPPRLPQFRRQFGDDLRRVPVTVASAALRLIGRLAAGELSAFRGARRLSSNREVWRQRVGSSYRLLFRTEGGRSRRAGPGHTTGLPARRAVAVERSRRP